MDNCGICMKPAEQLFETSREGVFACFKCQPLVPEVSMTEEHQEHEQEQQGTSLKCIICSKVLQTNKQLQVHLRNHTAERRFVCTYCSKAFTQSNNLRAHLRIHTNERPYKCHVCDKAFTQVTNLNNHVRLHTGERPYVCNEPGCDKAYAQVSTLNQHRKRHLDGSLEGRVPCSHCERSFDSLQRMAAHRAKIHGVRVTSSVPAGGTFVCKICDEPCKSKQALLRHVADHVGGAPVPVAEGESTPTSFKCVFSSCGATLSSPREHTEHLLRAHQLRVSGGPAAPPLPVRPRGRPRAKPKHSVVQDKSDPLASEDGFSYEVQVEQLKDIQYLPNLKIQTLFQ